MRPGAEGGGDVGGSDYSGAKLAFGAATFVLLGLCAAELLAILRINGGRFFYTLDDAYIHLALAENLAEGHYGVNVAEASAPSSSVLWPFILAPFVGLEIGEWIPLALNLGFAIGVLALLVRSACEILPARRRDRPFLIAIIALAGVIATNLLGLVFMGMEHTLQVFCSMLIAAGLAEDDGERVPKKLVVGIVLGPIIRYENLALALPGLVYLAYRRNWKAAIGGAAILVFTLGGFSAFLLTQGLPALPLSVLRKSAPMASGGEIHTIFENLYRNVVTTRGTILTFAVIIFIVTALRRSRRSQDRAAAAFGATAIAIHLLLGRFGWYYRYEIYIWAFSIILLLHLNRFTIRHFLESEPWPRILVYVGLIVAVPCKEYVNVPRTIPLATNNIFEQHFQMFRFATEFAKGPVAVNDLGRVAFRNPNYVLDLAGLGSPEASGRSRRGDASWMDELTTRRGVEIAMIYDTWFRKVPESWTPVGHLQLGNRQLVAGHNTVTFYSTSAARVDYWRQRAIDFSETLPYGVVFLPLDSTLLESSSHEPYR